MLFRRATCNQQRSKKTLYLSRCLLLLKGETFVFFHQQYPSPVTKRYKPMLFPTALLLIIYEIFAWRFCTNSKLFGSMSLAFEYNSTDDYRILKGANSISFRSTVRVLSTESCSSSPERIEVIPTALEEARVNV